MWTEITRRKYEREAPRYASDLTDAEWALIAATRCAPAFSNATLPTVRDCVNDVETAKLRRGVQACPQQIERKTIPMEGQRTAARLQLEGEPQLALRSQPSLHPSIGRLRQDNRELAPNLSADYLYLWKPPR